jgi:DNA-directed RNA polymerase I subunit RPA49
MEFGTKKAKNMIKSLAENAIIQSNSTGAPDATTKALIESIGEKVASMPTAAEQVRAAEESAPKPRANLDAQTPDDVYPLEILIPLDLLSTIDASEWMEKTKKKENISVTSQFVARRAQSIGNNKDLTKMQVLRYMYVIIDFFKHLGKGRESRKTPQKKKLSDHHPSSLVDSIYQRFCRT